MGLLSGAANAYFTYKFLRLMTQDWEDTDAFKLGVIDQDGKALKKVRDLVSSEEKDSYSVFNRLAFNLKRLLNKLPFGKSKLASYGAALYLIKEDAGVDDDTLYQILEDVGMTEQELLCNVSESYLVDKSNNLSPGKYVLEANIASPITAEIIAKPGHSIVIENTEPKDIVMGIPIYEAKHQLSGQTIYISSEDIRR
jgi:hypothetical protein